MNIKELLKELCAYKYEKEWFEFKENWFEPEELGKYISALSNAAAYEGMDYGYFVWGISDKNHEVVGTTFNPDSEYKNEPLKHFLARQISPENNFSFEETSINNKRIVVLKIPAARRIPTSWKDVRYIRIGSSKEPLNKYPEKEVELFKTLNTGIRTITNTPSDYQNLNFSQLLIYYVAKGIPLKENTFKENLGLLTEDGKYNIMAQLLSDDSHVSIRVATFLGKTKADPMYTVREFGHKCLLISLDEILRYGEVLNIPQADERDRVVERKEVPLFDIDAFREATINAFVHNSWIDLIEPMFTVYSDRIEILSRGKLAKGQSMDGFFAGKSIPVNKKLSDIFLQVHISERTGRGVPRIVDAYGKKAFDFTENDITVTIPFNRINALNYNERKENERPINESQKRIISLIKEDSKITKPEMSERLSVGKTTIDRAITGLKERNMLERVGSNKNGYWKILK